MKNNIEVKHQESANEQQRNDNRQQAINETFDNQFTLNKDHFIDYVKEHHLHNGKGKTLQQLRNTDFSQANPNNSLFLNEIKDFGKGLAKAFIEEFGIQLNKEKEAYQKDFQIVEQQDDDQTKCRYYIGTFENKEMERLTPFREDKEELQTVLDKHRVQGREQKQQKEYEHESEQELVLTREKKGS